MTDDISKFDVCNEISEDLSAFIDGELAKERLAKIYEHLLECKDCRKDYESLKITQKTLENYFQRSTEKVEIPKKQLKDNIISKIIFAQKQKMFVYSAAVFVFIAAVSYFSITVININQAKQESIHKVKFVKDTEKKSKSDKFLQLIPQPVLQE